VPDTTKESNAEGELIHEGQVELFASPIEQCAVELRVVSVKLHRMMGSADRDFISTSRGYGGSRFLQYPPG